MMFLLLENGDGHIVSATFSLVVLPKYLISDSMESDCFVNFPRCDGRKKSLFSLFSKK